MEKIKSFLKRLSSNRIMLVVLPVLLVLVLIAAVAAFFVYKDSRIKPEAVLVTNLTDTGATVTWYTEKKTESKVIVVGKDEKFPLVPGLLSKDEVFYDDRDVDQNEDGDYVLQDEGSRKRNTHHVTVRNLEPEKEYKFIVVGTVKGLEKDKDGKTFGHIYAQEINENLSTPDPAYGAVEGLDGDLTDNIVQLSIVTQTNTAIDSLTLENVYVLTNKLSTTVTNNGTYSVDLNTINRDNLKELPSTELYLLVEVITHTNVNAYHVYPLDEYKPLDTIVVDEQSITSSHDERNNFSSVISSVSAQDCPASGSCTYYDCSSQLVYNGNCGREIKSGFCGTDYPTSDPCGKQEQVKTNYPVTNEEANQILQAKVEEANAYASIINQEDQGCFERGNNVCPKINGGCNHGDSAYYPSSCGCVKHEYITEVDPQGLSTQSACEDNTREGNFPSRKNVVTNSNQFFPSPLQYREEVTGNAGEYITYSSPSCHICKFNSSSKNYCIGDSYSGGTIGEVSDTKGMFNGIYSQCNLNQAEDTEGIVPEVGTLGISTDLPKQGFVTSLSAQSDNSSAGLKVKESGQYVVYDGEDFETPVTEVAINLDGANQVEVRIYTDTNSNGKYDKGEPLMEDYSTLQLKKESEVTIYSLAYGWNLVALPIVSNEGVSTASELVAKFNEQGADVKHVAKFSDGNFVIYTNREGEQEYSNDFNLVPGHAYFVLNYEAASVNLKGNKFDEAVPFHVSNGWNLVGVYTNEQDYTAEELLKDMKDDGIQADTVSEYDAGKYTSVVYDKDTLYGNDYNLYERTGYFIRVETGGGNDKTFTPSPGE